MNDREQGPGLSTRCELAEKLAEALKPKARENQGTRNDIPPILAKGFKAIDTREQAAKEAGVSHGSLAAFKFLKENATPEEIEELKRNANAKLHRALVSLWHWGQALVRFGPEELKLSPEQAEGLTRMVGQGFTEAGRHLP